MLRPYQLLLVIFGLAAALWITQQSPLKDLVDGKDAALERSHVFVATGPGNLEDVDTLVLCPRMFVDELHPWIEYRSQQGHQILVVAPGADAYGIKQQIREVASHGNLQFVVLIGDAPTADPNSVPRCIPTDYIAAELVNQFGSEPEIATDNTFADLDDDGLPDLAIGRLAVDTPSELRMQVRKIIDYESCSGGAWQRRINFVAGTGGFGPLVDAVIERTSRKLIAELIPGEFETSMTYANWSSAYCPDPRQFTDVTLNRLNEGALFWVYMGHGHPHRLDFVRTPIGGFPMLRDRDIPRVECRTGHPIALMLSCYTGAFDMPRDCLAERLVNEPGGPIGVLCGSRVTMPAGMSLLSVGLIEEYFKGRHETLGAMLMHAKRQLVVTGEDPSIENSHASGSGKDESIHNQSYRETIAMLAETLNPKGDIQLEAAEHVHLFHLLGDPLLRVPRPHQLELNAVPNQDQTRLHVTGTSPHQGELLVELVYCRDRFQKRPPRRPEFKWDPQSLNEYRNVYEESSCRTVNSRQLTVSAGPFELDLDVPEWARGRCVVRGFLEQPNGKRYAMGAHSLRLKSR